MSSSSPLSISEARDSLAELVNRAAFGKERVLLARRGKPVAALVPVEDLEALEALEDERDLADARRALAEWEADPDSTVGIDELARKHGIAL